MAIVEPLVDLEAAEVEDDLSRLYLTMVRVPEPTMASLVERGFTEEQVRELTPVLIRRELIDRIGQDAWEARPPEVAMQLLAKTIETRAQLVRASASELGLMWRQARSSAGDTTLAPGMEPLRTVNEVVQSMHDLWLREPTRISIMLDDSPAARQWLQRQTPDPRTWTPPHRLEVRLVVDTALMSDPDLLSQLESRAESGQEVRAVGTVPFGVMVADHGTAVIDLSHFTNSASGSFMVRRGPGVDALQELVEAAYGLATPLRPSAEPLDLPADGRTPLDDRDRRVLGLLATGASDQMIARHLNISTRTVERRVRLLMDRLAAATRFQAGVMAARRDWV